MDHLQSFSGTRSVAQQVSGHQRRDKSTRAVPDAAHAEKQCTETPIEAKKSVYVGLGWLDRLLALWILLAIVVGILLGNFVDSVGPALQRGQFVGVSVPIGEQHTVACPRSIATLTGDLVVGLLVMMYPILCKVKYESLHLVFAHRQIWVQLGFSIFVNWIVAPLLMVCDTSLSTQTARTLTRTAWASMGVPTGRARVEKWADICRACTLYCHG